MDEYDKINNNEPSPQQSQSVSDANVQPNGGFYSYKRPTAANNPEYSATTAKDSAQTAEYTENPQNSAYSENAYQQSAYSAQSGAYQRQYAPVKPKKEKRKYSIGALVACCLICAIISGTLAAAGVLFAGNALYNGGSSSESSGNTVINVDKTAENTVSAVAQKVIPSVVGIRVTSSVTSFFGMSQSTSSEGSGVIYTSDGYIITNYHVISIAVEASNKSNAAITVYLSDDPETAIPAEVVGYNSDSDLAVIKIDKTGLTAVEFADSDKLEVGAAAIAVGNPGGLEYMSSVSSGVISGLNRTLKLEGTAAMKLIQTDAAINPGNSGGALTNSQGQLIGINSSKISSTDFEGMGFAIPSNYVKQVCDDIINNKDVTYAYLGVKISTEYDSQTLNRMGYPSGAVVESVDEDSPAYNAGIRSGDIITSFDGSAITSYTEYNNARLNASPGQTVELTIYRNDRSYTVSVTLGESTN